MAVNIKRIYDEVAQSDGYRILVDRLWPRGVSKEKANLDLWLKDIAPSPELRQWFNHDSAKMAEFNVRYIAELSHNPAVDELKRLMKVHKNITLLYAAKDTAVNHAAVLKDFIC